MPRSGHNLQNYSDILNNVELWRPGAGFAGPVSEGDGTGTDFYYSDRFQVIEDRVLGEEVLEGSQYVWSERYIDAMVLRDRDANYDDGDGREERLYVQQDASFNTTAVIDTEGTVVERVVYDPYGGRSFKLDDWSSYGSFSAYNWVYLFQGGRQDPTSNLVYFRGRDYSTSLGRFVQPDPLGYPDGANRYQMEGSSPVNRLDPMGLKQVDIEGAVTLEDNHDKYGPATAKITILPHFFDPNAKPVVPVNLIGDVPEDWPKEKPTEDPPLERNVPNELPGGPIGEYDPKGPVRLDNPNNELLKLALRRVLATKRGQEILAEMRRRGLTATISSTVTKPRGDSTARPDDDTNNPNDWLIDINQGVKIYYLGTDGEYHVFTLERLIAHELGHVLGTKDDGTGNMNNIHKNENEVMREISSFLRSSYEGFKRVGNKFVKIR